MHSLDFTSSNYYSIGIPLLVNPDITEAVNHPSDLGSAPMLLHTKFGGTLSFNHLAPVWWYEGEREPGMHLLFVCLGINI